MNQNLKNVAEGTLPRWKMRVRNKKMKERQRYDFTLEESFPHSPILQKKNNWGLENSYRKLKEWLGNDLQKKYNLNLKIQFERAARESKNNHFMLYSLMKRRITSDKHLFFGELDAEYCKFNDFEGGRKNEEIRIGIWKIHQGGTPEKYRILPELFPD
jgi:hypothetical protein